MMKIATNHPLCGPWIPGRDGTDLGLRFAAARVRSPKADLQRSGTLQAYSRLSYSLRSCFADR